MVGNRFAEVGIRRRVYLWKQRPVQILNRRAVLRALFANRHSQRGLRNGTAQEQNYRCQTLLQRRNFYAHIVTPDVGTSLALSARLMPTKIAGI
jgi:hypothetical protein